MGGGELSGVEDVVIHKPLTQISTHLNLSLVNWVCTTFHAH